MKLKVLLVIAAILLFAAVPHAREGFAGADSSDGMVRVPAGEFFMGCNEEVDRECEDDEKPGRTMRLKEFWIDKHEVTVAEYEECVKAGKCKNPLDKSVIKYCNWGYADRSEHPVNCVYWHQAKNYCEWRGKRLPSEAEWEKAARGPDGRIYPWGNDDSELRGMAVNLGCGDVSTQPVCSKPTGNSPYGLCDMAGSVWEWVEDWYDDTLLKRSLRGGSWCHTASNLRSSFRLWSYPVFSFPIAGFRCAR